jgi:ubiquinone/menaquinone biosynthesis C-methylase UbiE
VSSDPPERPPAGEVAGADPSDSVVFDPSVADYDRTRALPEDVRETLAGVLAEELAGRDPVVEVGVGTGRMALPLVQRGVRLIGVDLSAAMLAQLRVNAGGTMPFPLVQADATRLPIRSASVGGVLAVHVLHLIRPWRAAVAEMARIARPGGAVLIDPGSSGSADGQAFHDRFVELLGDVVRPIGLDHGERGELDEAMAELGIAGRDLPPVERIERETWGDYLSKIRDGRLSWTWRVAPEERARAVEQVRAWGEERFGDLDVSRPVPLPIQFRAYDVPGQPTDEGG